MRRFAFLMSGFLLSGCAAGPSRQLDLLFPNHVGVVVLAKQPVQLVIEPTSFASPTPMRVLGEWTYICLSLRAAYPLRDKSQMDRDFAAAMQGSNVRVTLIFADGQRTTLYRPLQAWSKYGVITEQEELMACATASAQKELPVGGQVLMVEVSAEPPLLVQGVFWESKPNPSQANAETPKTVAASSSTASAACAA